MLDKNTMTIWPIYPFERGGCFAVGTLVSTENGFVPIEKIRVGDMVLSQSETKGERAQKRVVKTMVLDEKVIRSISYTDNRKGQKEYTVAATVDHPFWVESKGWTNANLLREDDQLELANGACAWVTKNVPVYRTEQTGVGWVPYSQYSADDHFEHGTIGYEKNYIKGEIVRNGIHDEQFQERDDPYLKTRVYNFEVENFHTYYVGGGAGGVWVHNAGPNVAHTRTHLKRA